MGGVHCKLVPALCVSVLLWRCIGLRSAVVDLEEKKIILKRKKGVAAAEPLNEESSPPHREARR